MLKSLLLAEMLSFTSLTALADTTKAPPPATPTANQKVMTLLSGNYQIDTPHTRVSFIIPHFVISEVEGRFNDVEGNFTIGTTFLKSKFTATAKVASIDTGIKQRVALRATGKVIRRDFNINYDGKFDLGPVVGDDVEIVIITEGVKI